MRAKLFFRSIKRGIREHILIPVSAIITVLIAAGLYAGMSYYAYGKGLYSPMQTGKYTYMTEEEFINDFMQAMPETLSVKTKKKKDVVFKTENIATPHITINHQPFRDYLLSPHIVVHIDWDINWNRINNKIKKIQDTGHNAIIRRDENGRFYIEEGREAFVFSLPTADKIIMNSLKHHIAEADISKIVKNNAVSAEDLQEKYEELAWVNDWKIEYSDGTVIDCSTIKSGWYGYTFDIEKVDLSPVLEHLAEAYSSLGKTTEFKTSDKGNVNVTYATYGRQINKDAEYAAIKDFIAKKKSTKDREPVLYGDGIIGETYIEVSIGSQHVWHYVDGKLCCQADCVSGRKGNHDTPRGIFYVSEKVPGKYLTGPDYKTWVNRWMRLTNGGVGLHDADWRSNFGGNIYQSNGSHGCVNLPKGYAYALYDEINTGIPVVVHD